MRRINTTKLEIIQTASQMILENGYSATSVKAICSALDIGLGHMTFYFPSKEHLLAVIAHMLCDFQWKILKEEADGSTEMSEILNTNYQIGDVNGDGKINARDYALLMQYLNNWDVQIVETAADVNGDGNINARDYALLMQYLNNWDVTLG